MIKRVFMFNIMNAYNMYIVRCTITFMQHDIDDFRFIKKSILLTFNT